jgi:hypothetical protein
MMDRSLKGTGFLVREDRLVTTVRYRLRFAAPAGPGSAEGELWPRSRRAATGTDAGPGRYWMHTEDGLSVPLEVLTVSRDGCWSFRRLGPQERVEDRAEGVED